MDSRTRLLLSAAGVLALASAGLPAAAVDSAACGGTITASTSLAQDLRCTGDGLVIGASGTDQAPIVLDLNGHTISGAGGGAGIRFTGQNNVVVRNGTLTGFAAGVELQQSTRVNLTGLTVSAVYRGINVGGGGHHVIENNTVSAQNQDGIRLGATSDNVVAENNISNSVWGISIAGFTTSNLVEKNVVTGSSAHGIGAFGYARAVTIVENSTTANGDGLAVGRDVTDAVLEKNESRGNRDDGIQVDIVNARIVDNIATDNGDFGIEAVSGVTGTDNLAARNGQPAQCAGIVCKPAL